MSKIPQLTCPIVRQSVNSSNIESVGHNKDTNTMEIKFYSGQVYRYYPITEAAYLEMVKADSVSGYFQNKIRYNKDVTTTKVEPE